VIFVLFVDDHPAHHLDKLTLGRTGDPSDLGTAADIKVISQGVNISSPSSSTEHVVNGESDREPLT
jgi:hypothetical protein